MKPWPRQLKKEGGDIDSDGLLQSHGKANVDRVAQNYRSGRAEAWRYTRSRGL